MKVLLIVSAILFGALGLVLLLAAFPVRIYIIFDGRLTVHLRLFCVRFCVFDAEAEPKKKSVKQKARKQEKPAADSAIRDKLKELNRVLSTEGLGGYIRFARGLLTEIRQTPVKIGRAVSVRKLVLHAVVAAEEPDEAALRFGRTSAALASTQTLLAQTMRLKKSDVSVTPDFIADTPSFMLNVVVRICPLSAISAAAGGFFRIMGYTKRKLTEAKSSVKGGL